MRQTGPIPDSYWVEPGRLCAGPYPFDDADALRAAGIDTFVDLTEEGEYGLPRYARKDGLEYLRRPIPDFGVPAAETMREILQTLDHALSRGRSVYVHCQGGVGRTGTVVACHLVGRGSTAAEALASVTRWRQRPSPETDEQRSFVERWRG